jgi:CDP-glucose 4,6-dehydratase
MGLTISRLSNTYKGKKVLLTGHTGFKGTWMLNMLIHLGARVKGYSRKPKNDSDLYNLLEGNSLCESIFDDILNEERFEKEILSFQPDFIFHFAAQSLVSEGYNEPRETFRTNVIGTLNVLEPLKKLNKKCSVILITTDKVYLNKEWIFPYRENDELGGNDPYSASKSCSELVIKSFQYSFFSSENYNIHKKGIATARAGNIIGGGDWSSNRLIPDYIKSIYNKDVMNIRSPNSIRPWQHVFDPLLGYLQLGSSLDKDPFTYSEPFNFGPSISDCITVEEIINRCQLYWNLKKINISTIPAQMKESKALMLSTAKSEYLLDWKPQLSLNQALELTIDWYKVYFDTPEKIKTLSKFHIESFFNKIT